MTRYCPTCGEVKNSSLCTHPASAEELILAACPAFAEDTLLALRFLYYVKARPVVPDTLYDEAEKEYLARESTDAMGTPLNEVGSDQAESYPDRIKSLAYYLQFCQNEQHAKA